MADHLESFGDARVCQLQGAAIFDIFSFCSQLEPALGVKRVRRSIEARGGVLDALRSAPEPGEAVKRRFYVWHDAHILLKHDHQLFGRLVDAFAGVAAEAEYASEDRLVLHRALFIGTPALDVYAEDARGQFRTWLSENGEVPLWSVVSGLRRPPVVRYAIDPGLMATVAVPGRRALRA
jgi:hypothetical protein